MPRPTVPSNPWTATLLLNERLHTLCEKIDQLDLSVRELDARIDATPDNTKTIEHLSSRLAVIEGWHTWGVRAIVGAVIAEIAALVYLMG